MSIGMARRWICCPDHGPSCPAGGGAGKGRCRERRVATEELERLAAEYQRPAFESMALTARGSLLLHEGDATAAIRELVHRAWRSSRETGFPYESARARILC